MARLLLTVFLVSALVAINHIGSTRADVSSLTSDRKINLEDIERDTLINEIRSKSQETLHAEPTEHIPPTAAGQHNGQVQHVQHSGHEQHVQHNGPTGASPTAPGGAVSHQTIVYHQQHEQPQPTAGSQATYQAGITYAQQPTSDYPQSGPAFHYSHSAPGSPHPQAVQYVQQPVPHHQVLSHQPVVYYSHHAHYPQEAVQYVTFTPQHAQHAQYQHHLAGNLIATPVPQVHEEGRTFSAPSRHTLETNTQQQKYFKTQPPRGPIGFRPKQNLISPQPQYVYVQANNVASPQQQRQYQQKFQQPQGPPPQQQPPTGPPPQKVQNVEIIQAPGQQVAPVEYVSQQTPYYQYSGAFGHPQQQSVPVNNYVVVPYATNPNIYQHQQHQQQQQLAIPTPPQPTLAAQPIVPEVPHYVHPSKPLPSGPPPPVYIQSPHHPHPASHAYVGPSYPTVSYAPSYPGNGHPFNHGQNYNYYTPSLDFFGQYSRHQSLLDSYVPSNLIYSKARQIYGPYYNQPHSPAPQIHPQHSHQIEPDHSPIYNTIAYSTEQRPVVVPPPAPQQQPSKRESTVLRAAPAPPKPTTLTKIENIHKQKI